MWWDELNRIGPLYGYYPNASKTCLIAAHENAANEIFAGSGITISMKGNQHLGAALGSRTFVEEFVSKKVATWVTDVKQLAEIAHTQPQAAYAAYIHGLSSRWLFLLCTVPDMQNVLQPLEDSIHQFLIPAITVHPPCSKLERELLALPIRLVGMGILNPMTCSSQCFNSSKQLTSPFVALIISQEDKLPSVDATLSETRKSIHSENRKLQNALADCIYANLSAKQQRLVDLSREKVHPRGYLYFLWTSHWFFLQQEEWLMSVQHFTGVWQT